MGTIFNNNFCYGLNDFYLKSRISLKYLNTVKPIIPAEYYKINTAIWKDQQENM